MKEAARILGVSNAKMWRLVKGGELPAHPNPLDRREKLVRREDLERLRARSGAHPRFVSDGSDTDPVEIPASRIKDWVREAWQRDKK
jgi:excisionase family DNA binding protein